MPRPSPWPQFHDDWYTPHSDLVHRLRRRVGRVITVGTGCGVKTGRLRAVGEDYITLRTRKGRLFIRIEAICWTRLPRRRRRRCGCSQK